MFLLISPCFIIEKNKISIDKVFPQFNNLQNFAQWNDFFVTKKGYKLSYYTPYEGAKVVHELSKI